MAATFKVIFAQAWLLAAGTQGHVVLTYPGWRGNNLAVNDEFPYGMQRAYPCGGLSVTRNRTAWPISGGAIALQPGWFAGHDDNLMYINLGLGSQPENYTSIWPMFEIIGPSNNPYPGTICLPQVTLPGGIAPKSGDDATIQIIQTLKSGAALYTCADITFTDDSSQVPAVNASNCFNSSNIKVEAVRIARPSEVLTCSGSSSTGTATTASDLWGTATSASGRSSLFATSTTTSEESLAARGMSRFSALLSFLLLI